MDLAIWVIGGGVIGGIAAYIIGTDRRQTFLIDVLLGVAGAVATGLLIAPVLGAPSINAGRFSAGAAVVAMIGAVAAVILGNAARKRWAGSPKGAGAATRGRSN